MPDEKIALPPEYPVWVQLPVQWGEQDLFGHVNNIVYFRWFETARFEYGIKVGLTKLFEERRIGPILAAVQCQYKRQVRHPATVLVGARITRIGRSSMTMLHQVLRMTEPNSATASYEIVAEGDSTVVCFDYAANRPISVPDDMRAAIRALEKQDL